MAPCAIWRSARPPGAGVSRGADAGGSPRVAGGGGVAVLRCCAGDMTDGGPSGSCLQRRSPPTVWGSRTERHGRPPGRNPCFHRSIDWDCVRMLAACAPERPATGSGTWSGELLPYWVAAEQPFDDPLHAETCPIAYASKRPFPASGSCATFSASIRRLQSAGHFVGEACRHGPIVDVYPISRLCNTTSPRSRCPRTLGPGCCSSSSRRRNW